MATAARSDGLSAMTSGARSVVDALSLLDHHNVRLAVTGAGGWLGRELADILLDAWGEEVSERLLLLATRTRSISLASGRDVQLQSLDETNVAAFAPTHVVHLAFLTRERVSEMPLEQYSETNRELTRKAIDLLNLPSVNGIMFTSSGAALSPAKGTDADRYGELKREDESILPRAAMVVGKNCVTCRVWSVSGANMQKVDQFAFGSLITQGIASGELKVHAPHAVFRRYVDAGEYLGLGLLALLNGETVVVDSAGERVEVGELARRVAAVAASDSRVVRPPVNADVVDDYSADPASMEQLAAKYHVQFMDLDTQIRRTDRGIRANRSVGGTGVGDP